MSSARHYLHEVGPQAANFALAMFGHWRGHLRGSWADLSGFGNLWMKRERLHVLALARAPLPAVAAAVSPMRFARRGLASNRSRQPRGCDSSPPLRASAAGTPACGSPNHAPGSALSGEARRRRHSSGAGRSARALQHPPPNPPAPSPWGEWGEAQQRLPPLVLYHLHLYLDKQGVILLCYQGISFYHVSLTGQRFYSACITPFISRASHPALRGPNRVVANDTQLTIATAHRVWYDGKQPQPERLVDESGLPDHLRPTCKG
jgi:hypothetical protein